MNDLDGEDFNPHHCISGDTDVDSEADKLEISIHTTASVVTSTFFPYEVVQAISIHTTASVVTYTARCQILCNTFQSTPLHQW